MIFRSFHQGKGLPQIIFVLNRNRQA